MDTELVQLAREAVTALQVQAAGSTRWVEVAQLGISGVGLVISAVGLAAILVGLKRMGEAGQRRDREIDELAGAFRKQGEAMTQAFTQQGQALGKIGQALDHQGEALRQQGRALETLIERTAAR